MLLFLLDLPLNLLLFGLLELLRALLSRSCLLLLPFDVAPLLSSLIFELSLGVLLLLLSLPLSVFELFELFPPSFPCDDSKEDGGTDDGGIDEGSRLEDGGIDDTS